MSPLNRAEQLEHIARRERAAQLDPEAGRRDPQTVATDFLYALLVLEGPDGDEHLANLRGFVTTESLDAWGDFRSAVAALRTLGDPTRGGLAQSAQRPPGACDVAYLDLLRLRDGEPAETAASLNLVWRPEQSSWLIHALGYRVDPDDRPRTSPDDAPQEQLPG